MPYDGPPIPREFYLEIAKGNIPGHSSLHKFGEAPDFDTEDSMVDIWDGADDGGIDAMVYTYSSTADIDSLVSSNDSDTEDIEIQGLDVNFAMVTQTVTLTGRTRAALSTSLIRVFRMINRGNSSLAGTVSCYVDSAISNGVVTDKTKVRAIINNGNNQTLMSLYTVPAGKTGYIVNFFLTVAGAKKTAEYQVDFLSRPTGEVFQLKKRHAIQDGGSTSFQHDFVIPEVFAAKTDIVMRTKTFTAGVTGAAIAAGFDLILINT